MEVTKEKNDKIGSLNFAIVYNCYLKKIEKKNRTKNELNEVIEWLTGYKEQQILDFINKNVTLKIFFEKANINANAKLIKGVICGYRIENINFELAKNGRRLDKLVDELAKGYKLDKILKHSISKS